MAINILRSERNLSSATFAVNTSREESERESGRLHLNRFYQCRAANTDFRMNTEAISRVQTGFSPAKSGSGEVESAL
jgi:hypothetical protein